MVSFFDSAFDRKQADNVECYSSYSLPLEGVKRHKGQTASEIIDQAYISLDRAALAEQANSEREFTKPTWEMEWVRTSRQLKELCRRLERAPIFAVDTETSEGRAGGGDLSERLCLIQIGLPKHRKEQGQISFNLEEPGKTYLIDVVALEAEAKKKEAKEGHPINPLTPLKNSLEDFELPKIIQHKQFEEGQFEKYGIKLNGVIDIEKLSKELRSDLVSHSLASVSLEVAGKLVDKGQQKSAWNVRPLSAKQVEYAALDTELNFEIWGILQWYHERLENDLERDLGVARVLNRETGEETALKRSEIDILLQQVFQTEREEHQLIQSSGVGEALATLDARVDLLKEHLKKNLLPAELEALKAKIEDKDGVVPEGLGVSFDSTYGSAYYAPQAIKQVDLDTLKGIDPALVDQVVTFETTKKAIESYLREKGELKRLKTIWEEINQLDGSFTEPSLKISFKEASQQKFTVAVEALTIPENQKVDDILRTIIECEVTRLKILRESGLANELGFLNAKKARYADEIFSRLLEIADQAKERSASFENEIGTVSFESKPRKSINLELFIEKYPDIAANTLKPESTQEKVADALRARNFDPQTVERLTLEVFKETGEFTQPKARIYPYYSVYYKGEEDRGETLKLAA